jgi:TonB family protein
MFSFVFATTIAAAQAVTPHSGPSRPQAPAPPNVPASFLARDDSGSGVFESNLGTQNEAWLADRFSEAFWQNDNSLRALNGNSPRTLDDYKKSSEYTTTKKMLNIMGRWKAGNRTKTWVFDSPGPLVGLPRRALELDDLSGPDGYRVRATIHCYEEPEACDLYRKRQVELPAPKPQAAAGDLALRQWRNRVFDEECTERAVNMEHPRYPSDALREGKGGNVFLGILFNRCGDVRDSWIIQSSGHLSLDRAAMGKALEWRLDLNKLPPDGMQKRIGSIPLRFIVGDSLPPN